MKNQLIIAVSREFGSGGHVIAEKIAEKYNLPRYDYNLLREISIERNLEAKTLERYDERPKSKLFSRTIRGYSSSPEENIAELQFDFLRKRAEEGESFVVVGRCAETILKEYSGLISFFILGDMDKKIERTVQCNHISDKKAKKLIRTHDRKRKAYHNYYCERKWGDSRIYDVCINSSRLGLDETTNILIQYIESRLKNS